MKKDKIVIIGSTGSIGTQSIDVINTTHDKEIVGLSCNSNIDKLYKQVIKTNCKYVAIYDTNAAEKFHKLCKKKKIKVKIFDGMEGLNKLSRLREANIVIISVVGMIGIRPTIEAIKAKKIVCLANKESLVCAGDIIMPLARKNKVEIRPIDSEHSAMWQSLVGERPDKIKKLLITASGGPFYGKTISGLKKVKLSDALKHPNWSMGKKITIDSSTLVNKGLEVMEAHHLFNIPYDKIEVVVQRESLIHSMVEFVDGAIKAELGVPSMRIPIEYAIYKENRKFINEKTLDFSKLKKISIGKPDLKTFKGLKLAFTAIKIGGLMPSVYNALNEVAVKNFLNENIKYLEITDFIEKGMKAFAKKKLNKKLFSIEDIEETYVFAEHFYNFLYDKSSFHLKIRKSKASDFTKIKEILLTARNFIKESGNPQWNDIDNVTSNAKKDIENDNSYVVLNKNKICGVFSFILGKDPTYAKIKNGKWLNNEPYGTIHRVASDRSVKGVLNKILSFCEAKYNNIRIDTHEKNLIMQHILQKNGYKKCGIINISDGSPRIAYQKKV